MREERKLINKGNNLAIVLFLTAVALGLIGELIFENELIDKLDDFTIIVIAVILLIWYLTRENKFKVSIMPVIATLLVFAVKVCAFVIEFDDPMSVGDEFGLILPILFITIVSIVFYVKARRSS